MCSVFEFQILNFRNRLAWVSTRQLFFFWGGKEVPGIEPSKTFYGSLLAVDMNRIMYLIAAFFIRHLTRTIYISLIRVIYA